MFDVANYDNEKSNGTTANQINKWKKTHENGFLL